VKGCFRHESSTKTNEPAGDHHCRSNGAGKTTFAAEFLPHEASCPRFINADLIAAGLAPFDIGSAAVRAARLMLTELRRCVAARESFAFETTLSGRSYLHQIRQWQSAGCRVNLIFLRLRSVRLAIARVKARVAQGGHFVPAAIIRRRFHQGWVNFERCYMPLVDHWNYMTIRVSNPCCSIKETTMIRRAQKKKTPAALAALERAAKKAQEQARRTGTAAYVMENGRIIDVAARSPGKRGKGK